MGWGSGESTLGIQLQALALARPVCRKSPGGVWAPQLASLPQHLLAGELWASILAFWSLSFLVKKMEMIICTFHGLKIK